MQPGLAPRLLATLLMLGLAGAARAEPDAIEQWLATRGTSGAVAPAERSRMSEMVVAAMNFVGVPYRLGGNDAEGGFDCSGFTKHLFQLNLGFALPRRSHEQAAARGLVDVSRRDLQPGDLVFFNTLRRAFSHVGIYVGDGRFIHSPRAGAAVRLEDMKTAYWQRRFDGARRVGDTAGADDTPDARQLARAAAPAGPVRPQIPTDHQGSSH